MFSDVAGWILQPGEKEVSEPASLAAGVSHRIPYASNQLPLAEKPDSSPTRIKP